MLNKQQILEKALRALSLKESASERLELKTQLEKELAQVNLMEGKPAGVQALIKIAQEFINDVETGHEIAFGGVVKDGQGNLVVSDTHVVLMPHDPVCFKDLKPAIAPVKPESIDLVVNDCKKHLSDRQVTVTKRQFLSACRLHKDKKIALIYGAAFYVPTYKRLFKASSKLVITLSLNKFAPAYVQGDTFDAVVAPAILRDKSAAFELVEVPV